MRYIQVAWILVLLVPCEHLPASAQDTTPRVIPELIVDVDVNDEVAIRKEPLTETDIKNLVAQLRQNGCQTLIVRCGFLGFLP
jgi:hypothetical protein